MKGKTTRKECFCKFLAIKEYHYAKSTAQHNKTLELKFFFSLYFCSILSHQDNDIPFKVPTIDDQINSYP